MDFQTLIILTVLTLVGFACGIAIFLANRFLPKEDKYLKRTEEIAKFLPGMNCGACGKPGCFAYAAEVAKDINILKDYPCVVLSNDEAGFKALGEVLGINLAGGVQKVAIIHCAGDSEILYEYNGVSTCKGTYQLSSGYKKCPYGCIGFGDCASVCPVDAISIDQQKHIALVDPAKCIGCSLCVLECPNNLIEMIPIDLPQFLACNYLSKINIPGRERCDIGCIHCKLCVKASENNEVTWNETLDLPSFDAIEHLPAQAAIEKCPKKIIFKRDLDHMDEMLSHLNEWKDEHQESCCTVPEQG